MQWLTLIAALAAVAAGAWLDGLARPEQPQLFWCFTVASAAGVPLGLRWLKEGRAWVWLLAPLLWRAAWFPILVCAGFVASVVEWLVWLSGAPTFIYPTFLLAIAALHGGAAVTMSLALRRWWGPLAAAPLLASALLVSFTAPEDRTILPDRPWPEPRDVPRAAAPDHNPYLPLLSTVRSVPQNTLLLCAGVTYEIIPPAPWASTVQGTLEGLTEANPDASTADRIAEHYQAYQAAHPRIRRWR